MAVLSEAKPMTPVSPADPREAGALRAELAKVL